MSFLYIRHNFDQKKKLETRNKTTLSVVNTIKKLNTVLQKVTFYKVQVKIQKKRNVYGK